MLIFIALLSVLLMAVLLLIFNRLLTGHWDYTPCDYDERQKIARNLASRDTLWIVIALLCIWYIVQSSDLSLPVSDADVTILIALLGATLYAVDCIFRGAYLGLHGHPIRWAILYMAALALNLANAWFNYTEGDHIYWLNLLVAVMFGAILIAFGIRTLMDHGAEMDDEA